MRGLNLVDNFETNFVAVLHSTNFLLFLQPSRHKALYSGSKLKDFVGTCTFNLLYKDAVNAAENFRFLCLRYALPVVGL